MLRSVNLCRSYIQKSLLYSCFAILLLILSGCNSNSIILVSKVNQDTANEILLQLGQNDIVANKQEDKDKTFSILVSKKNQLQALITMHSNGFPAHEYQSIGEIFKKDSFISSPLEEQGRFIFALEQQISKMISQIDGVINVECQVSLPPTSDNLWQEKQIKPAAAVFIKYKQGYRLDLYTNRIKQLVANSVPGLVADDVVILTMTPVLDK